MEMSVRNRNNGRMREGDEREGHPEERKKREIVGEIKRGKRRERTEDAAEERRVRARE